MIVCHQLLDHIGAGADDDAGFKVAGVHVDDAAIGVAQGVHQGGIGLAGGDGQYLAVGLNGGDFRITGSTVVVGQQVLQALLHTAAPSIRRPLEKVTPSRRVMIQVQSPSLSQEVASQGSSSMVSV